MLACARLGAPHTVIFGGYSGYSGKAVADRVADKGCTVLVIQDQAVRAGRTWPQKANADEGVHRGDDPAAPRGRAPAHRRRRAHAGAGPLRRPHLRSAERGARGTFRRRPGFTSRRRPVIRSPVTRSTCSPRPGAQGRVYGSSTATRSSTFRTADARPLGEQDAPSSAGRKVDFIGLGGHLVAEHGDDPVTGWAAIVEHPERARRHKSQRGGGRVVRASREEAAELVAAAHMSTIKRYAPDRIAGFSPILTTHLSRGCPSDASITRRSVCIDHDIS
jgi:hypothetical protein